MTLNDIFEGSRREGSPRGVFCVCLYMSVVVRLVEVDFFVNCLVVCFVKSSCVH